MTDPMERGWLFTYDLHDFGKKMLHEQGEIVGKHSLLHGSHGFFSHFCWCNFMTPHQIFRRLFQHTFWNTPIKLYLQEKGIPFICGTGELPGAWGT